MITGKKIFWLAAAILLLSGSCVSGKAPNKTHVGDHMVEQEITNFKKEEPRAENTETPEAAIPTPIDPCAGTEKPEEPLPIYQSDLNGVPFWRYLQDECGYLENLLDEQNSAPGTVVMPIMLHSISDNCERSVDGSCVTEEEFYNLMDRLIENDFQAISTEQFIGFLYENKPIPYRSVLLIADDRRNGIYFDRFFRPYYEEYGWPVVSAYIANGSLGPKVLAENIALEEEGWVDHQAHGANHNIPIMNWRFDAEVNGMNAYKYIDNEISYPIQFFGEHFDKRPILFVWPGGGFTKYAAELAASYGYRAAFTINQNGPIFYNLVPLGAEYTLDVPLFVLPRYWSYAAASEIENVLSMQAELEEFFNENEDLIWNYLCACRQAGNE